MSTVLIVLVKVEDGQEMYTSIWIWEQRSYCYPHFGNVYPAN